jgi:pyruvate/2-oxoglutarate dehydrogenase complex dihydrolipoamide dehydrogenase (E3) component
VRLASQAYFVVGPKEPRSVLAGHLGLKLSAKGHIQTDWRGQTNVPGVWAAGDVQPQTQQVSVALGSGNMAAVMIDQTLTQQGLRSLGTVTPVHADSGSVGGDGMASHLDAPVNHASNTGF